MTKVPPNKRIYISEEEIPKYSKMGITVYTGPKGGKYINADDLQKINRQINQNVDNKFKWAENELKLRKLSEVARLVSDKLEYDRGYVEGVRLDVARELEKRLVGLSEEKIKDLSAKFKVANCMRIKSYAKKIGGDISNLVVEKFSVEVDSLNADRMKVFVLKDGSRVFAKKVEVSNSGDFEEDYIRNIGIINDYLASFLLRLFSDNDIYRSLLPHTNFVKINDEIYIASEEIFGLLGSEAASLGRVKLRDSEYLREFIASAILTGLWDVNGSNFMIIPDESIIIPFDFDFIGAMKEYVFSGPIDILKLFETEGKFDFKDIVKRVIERHDKFDNQIEEIIENLLYDVSDYLLDAGFDIHDLEEAKTNFMQTWEDLRELKEQYKQGEIDEVEFLFNIGSDVFSLDEIEKLRKIAKGNVEIMKAGKVPPEFRIYVSAWQAQRLRRNGIKVYRGPRGGLYIDSREAKRRNVNIEQLEESNIDVKLKNIESVSNNDLEEISNEVMKDVKVFLKVRSEFGKSVDYLVEHMIDFKLGDRDEYIKHYRRAMNLSFVLNKGNTGRMSNNPGIMRFKNIDFSSAGAKPGIVNVSSMRVVEMPDGSKIYMKRVDSDTKWVVNSLTAPTILKVLVGKEYSSFIPTPRIVSNEKEAYVGISEVFGINGVDTSYEEDVRDMETFKRFLAAHYVIGLADVHSSNYFMDPIHGTFIQYDFDYSFIRGKDPAHIASVIEIFAERYGFDVREVKEMGIRMLIDKYDEVKTNLSILRKAVRLYAMPDDVRQVFIDEILRAEIFVDNVVKLGRKDVEEAIKFIERDL